MVTQVKSSNIAVGAITTDQIAAGAITVADIPDGEITAAKLHTTLDLSSKTITYPTNSVTAASLHTTAITDKLGYTPLQSSDLTGYATETYVNTAVSNLVDSAPGTLDTLNELAAALGDDANYASTITSALALKAPLASPSFTGNLSVDTNTLYVDATNNRVGIGTNSPPFKLAVATTTQGTEGIRFYTADSLNRITIHPDAGAANNNPMVQAGDTAIIYSGNSIDTGSLVIGQWSASSKGIRIDSNGNVGIGLTGPSEMLEVNGNAHFRGTSANAPALQLGQFSDLAYSPLVQMFCDDVNGDIFDITLGRYLSDFRWSRQSTDGKTLAAKMVSGGGSPRSTQFYLYEQATGAATSTAKVALNTSGNSYLNGGNVGIGTSSPDSKLHVSYGSIISNGLAQVKSLTIESDSDGAVNVITPNTNTGYINFGDPEDSNSGRIWYNHPSNFMAFGVNGSTERMRIDSSGRVGIGTSSPITNLNVRGGVGAASTTETTTQSNSLFALSSPSTGTKLYQGIEDGNRVWLQAQNTDNGLKTIALNPAGGNVGIGTSSPVRLLQVGSYGLGNGEITLASSTTGYGSILFGDGGTGTDIYRGYVQYNHSSDAMLFGISASERMRITSTGNVGIGTTSPSYKLEVNGSFAATTKSFIIDHPTKPDMKLRYGSLEGPENGVYVRGKLKASGKIYLPDYWVELVHEDSITVNLTPIGSHQKLYVKEIKDNIVIVEGLTEDGRPLLNIECYYIVFAERKDVDKLEVEF